MKAFPYYNKITYGPYLANRITQYLLWPVKVPSYFTYIVSFNSQYDSTNVGLFVDNL